MFAAGESRLRPDLPLAALMRARNCDPELLALDFPVALAFAPCTFEG